jgi:hypothetical protein
VLDSYLDTGPEHWQAMLQSIRVRGRAEREFTCNSLDLALPEGLHENATGDGNRAGKILLLQRKPQCFFDISAQVEQPSRRERSRPFQLGIERNGK